MFLRRFLYVDLLTSRVSYHRPLFFYFSAKRRFKPSRGSIDQRKYFPVFHGSNHLQSYELSNEAGWRMHHRRNKSINPTKENTSIAHNFYFRSNEYGCKISPQPWPISTYHLPRIILVYHTHELTRLPRPGNNRDNGSVK